MNHLPQTYRVSKTFY